MIFPSISHFLTLALTAVAILTTRPALAAANNHEPHEAQTPSNSGPPSPPPPPPPLPAGVDLLQTSIRHLNSFLHNGSLTSVQLVQAYLANIERDNLRGLNLRAVFQVAPEHDLLRIAQMLDDERSAGTVRSEMHGIPILVKDNIATARELGMHTTGGSLALDQNAFVVKRLRDAGAIVRAKSSLTEFAAFKGILPALSPSGAGKGTTNGWSALGGQTSSAYVFGGFDAGGNPMGSSSGSAVGVSAGWAAGALGTDTAGSTVGPASRAALYAIRPTLGLLSRSGVMPVSLEHDTVGPMGITAYDVALMLELMMGRDKQDDKTSRIPRDYPTSLTQYALPPHATFSSLSLGFVRGPFHDSPDPTFLIPGSCPQDVKSTMVHAIAGLRALGANVTSVEMPVGYQGLRAVREAHVIKWINEFREDWEGFLPSLSNRSVDSLEELVNFNDRHAAAEMPSGECCQELLVSALAAKGRGSPAHVKATETLHRLAGERGLDYLFAAELGLDALVFAVELGQPLGLTGAMGCPAATVPLSYCANGLPYGLMFVTRKWHEPTLISMMAAWEASWESRRVPEPLLESNRPQ